MTRDAPLLVIDQGTTSTRAIVFGADGSVRGVAQRELPQIYPAPGWVEHDAVRIWQDVQATVRDALAAAGPPRQESAEGIKATHPVFVDVDPFSMQVQAVPSLFALGPLRGDNFARFAIHDGWGVAHAIRTQAAQVEGSQQQADGSLCEPEATAAAAVAAVQDLK